MQAKTRWWLLGVLALVIVALLGVLEPIKVQYRRDPDTGRSMKPLATVGPFHFYKPYPAVSLGLDLRGGMHLVLQAQSVGVFPYSSPNLNSLTSNEQGRTELLGKVVEALPEDKLAAPGQSPEDIHRTVSVGGDTVTIQTRVADDTDLKRQAAIITNLLNAAKLGLQPKGEPSVTPIRASDMTSIQRILENRVNAYGVAEPVIQTQPDQKRIIVELPGIKDPAKAQDLIQKTAVLEFRAVPRKYAYGEQGRPDMEEVNGREIYHFKNAAGQEVPTSQVIAESEVIASGRNLKPGASEVINVPGQQVQVRFVFQGPARKVFEDYTRSHVGYYLAVVLDNEMIQCPIIKSPIPGEGVIEGGFNGVEGLSRAKDLSVLLNAGALPFDLKYVENQTVSPELGADALHTSLIAGLIGLAAVLVFMVLYYRLPGLLADLALVVYIVLLMGAIKLVNQVLTLPGILAVIISIGMAVDANVIIFERLKEEIRSGKTLRSAVEAAFKRAWTAILDSNVCSIGTGIVLYAFGTGPIKGFAVALVIGVAVSLFTAVTVTRLFMNLAVEAGFGRNTALFGVSPKEVKGA